MTWADAKQWDWLVAKIPSYCQAREEGKSAEWLRKLYADWDEEWGRPKPTQEEMDKWNVYGDKANIKKCVVGLASKTHAKKDTMLREWQVYYELYEEYMDALIDDEWKEYLISSQYKTEPKQSDFEFKNAAIQKHYKLETKAVKDEVKAHIEALRKKGNGVTPKASGTMTSGETAKDESGAVDNNTYENSIKKLPAAITESISELARRTGWNLTVLTGGPRPSRGGKIDLMVFHIGTDKDGNNWPGWMGSADFEEKIVNRFDDFLRDCFPGEECNSRSLAQTPLHADTMHTEGQSTGGKRKGKEGVVDCSQGSEDKEGSIGSEAPVGPTLPPVEYVIASNGCRMSRNEAERLDRIAEIDAAMMQIKATWEKEDHPPSIAKKVVKCGPRKPKENIPVNRTPRRSARLGTVGEGLPGHEKSNNDTTVMNNEQSAERFSPEAAVEHQSSDIQVASQPSVNSESASNHDGNAHQKQLTAHRSADTNSMAASPIQEDNPTQMSSNNVSSPGGNKINTLPKYAQPYVKYLMGVSSDPRWSALITEWQNFELKMPHESLFSTTNRPKEVAWWIRRHRSPTAIPQITTAEFGSAWMKWWTEIQPEWHKNNLVRTIPSEACQWETLFRGGALGLCSVVMSLSWWVATNQTSSDGTTTMESLWDAVEDMTWVIQQVSALPEAVAAKRALNMDIGLEKPRKR
ncbi:hypothetical protein BDQ17DRAFT_1430180 [Cyathus striatus]|nr:hypothetical protein BDQ17DRAFT_1430180 [Cyathus striatus]